MTLLTMQSRAKLIVIGAWVLILSLSLAPCVAGEADPQLPVAKEISREATMQRREPGWYPLPLAGHWNTGTQPNGFSPIYQMKMIAQGHYLLPWFQMPDPSQDEGESYYKEALMTASRLGLPISFVGSQWEKVLSTDKAFVDLPANENPNVVETMGVTRKEVSPFGSVGPWYQAGEKWTNTKMMRRFQTWYPNPPLVLFVSNNEHNKLNWVDIELDRRYLDRYGIGRDSNFKRKVIGDGWISRYSNLISGMRGSLTPLWATNSRFIGYNAFETWSFGLQRGWERYSLHTADRISPWPEAWQGTSVPYYMYDFENSQNDYTVYSPQIHAMNWLFMLQEALKQSVNFWFELSTWDGHNTKNGSDKRIQLARVGNGFGPARYEGFVQFGSWLTRPRVVREFRFWDETRIEEEAYFDAVMRTVDRVHNDSTLRRFWRSGRLVPNLKRQHPFQVEIPAQYKNIKRWYLLDTNIDPPGAWSLSTELPVFAIALVMGDAPRREWLVYAFSPLAERTGIEVSIPDYKSIAVSATPQGVFYLASEFTNEVSVVGR